MRKTVGGVALFAAAALLLTGCGSDSADTESSGADDRAAESNQSEPANNADDADDTDSDTDASDDSDSGDAGGDDLTREVTFEVIGDGKPQGQVMYGAGDMNSEDLDKLPWKKTTKVTLQGAQAKVGVLVNIVPPSMTDASGMAVNSGCVITVDGKKVADNNGGEETTPCEYTMK